MGRILTPLRALAEDRPTHRQPRAVVPTQPPSRSSLHAEGVGSAVAHGVVHHPVGDDRRGKSTAESVAPQRGAGACVQCMIPFTVPRYTPPLATAGELG